MPTMKPSPDDEDIAWASADAERAQRIIDLYQAHQQPDISQFLPMLDQMQHGGSAEIDAMTLEDLRTHAKELLALVTHLSKMLAHGDVNRVALGLQDNKRALQAAGIISKLDTQTRKARNDRKEGAARKLAKDPKQAAKVEAKELWQDWQTGKTLHKSGAAFHRFVCDQFPVITSTKTVERWCKEWSTEGRNRD